MTLAEFNLLAPSDANRELLRCCGSASWAERMLARRPFLDIGALLDQADGIWWSLPPADWLAAFAAHPEIGAAPTSAWSGEEQAGMANVTGSEADAMRRLNSDYRARFGYLFLICATGKTAENMQAALQQRLLHPPEQEIRIAAAEQAQIIALRLRKLLQA